MKHLAVACACIALLSGCGGGGDSGGGTVPPVPVAANVLAVSVGASRLCANVNELCAQVTLCQPGTSSCQTIPDILVDTGSFGLRIFGSVLSPSLLQEVDSQGRPIGECAFFADGTAFWGPVQRADVVLGGEPAVNVPVHVIAPTFAGQSSSTNPCNSLVDSDPRAVFFNGILGVGVFTEDCGPVCAAHSNNNLYFSCVASTCTGAAVPLSDQVQNPVWLLPSDNNGVILSLPNVPSTGAAAVSGWLIFGIGTAPNNTPPAGLAVFATDQNGLLTTVYNGTIFGQSVVDSGSNGYFFPDPDLTGSLCASPFQGFYCPLSPASLSATLVGTTGQQGTIPFQLANAVSLLQTGNAVFNNLGGPSSTFVWGLPFFLGRTAYIGIESHASPLGTGPLVAF